MNFKNSLLTPISLWSDFDDSLPLKSTTVSKMKVDGAIISEVYFSGRAVGNERVRIFGYYSVPDDITPKGAILYIPNDNEKIGSDTFKEFLSVGYAVLAIDVYGKREGSVNHSEYPTAVYYANVVNAGRRKDFVDESAKETCWYEWVAVGRYAVKYLKEIGFDSICLAGNKIGANVGWQIAAFDKRVTCFIAMFGAGWTAYKNVCKFDENAKEPIEADDSSRKYVAAVDAHAYAPYVRCPILYLTSTNSTFFDFDRAGDTLSRVNDDVPCFTAYSVGYDAHLSESAKIDVLAFLETYIGKKSQIRPKHVDLVCTQEGDKLRFEADYGNLKAKNICVYVNEGVKYASKRDWVRYEATEDELGKRSVLYSIESKGIVFAFCSVEFADGTVFCSKEIFKKVEKTSDKKLSSKLIYSSKKGLNGLTFIDEDASISIFADKNIEEIIGPDGIVGAYSQSGLLSFKLCDPDFSLTDASILKFDAFVNEYCPLTLTLYEDDGEIKKYSFTQELKSENIWQNILVKISDFKSDVGFVIKNYDKVFAMSIKSDAKFVINNVLII